MFDLRERNKNTVRMTSPLPDIDGVLRRVAAKKYRSVLDLTAAYEQIRVIPEHIDRTAMSTPDGNMVSLVLQMGDCNAPATYQSLMNYVFSPYIGRFLDVYLDDVIIYSDTLDEHMKHCMLAIDILEKEKLYLSKKKLKFLPNELKLLGRICYDFYITSYFSPFLSLPPPIAGRSWYTVISSYLSITTYCLLSTA